MAEEDAKLCKSCGYKVEDGRSMCCYGCYLDGLIPHPAAYMRREKYTYTEAHRGGNATLRPKTGNKLLDATPLRFSQMDLPKGLLSPW